MKWFDQNSFSCLRSSANFVNGFTIAFHLCMRSLSITVSRCCRAHLLAAQHYVSLIYHRYSAGFPISLSPKCLSPARHIFTWLDCEVATWLYSTVARDALPIFLYMKHAPVRVPLMNRLGTIKCFWFLGYVSRNKATKKVSNAMSLGSWGAPWVWL